MAKYHAVKTRKAATPAASMRLWRKDAEKAYWRAQDPHFLLNIPPDIIRSYQPGTGLEYPELPDLASPIGEAMQHESLEKRQRVENIVENALRHDGTLVQYLHRPYNKWCIMAVTATPLAVPMVPARGRGKTLSNGNAAPTEAVHVSVQRAAFRAHPISLLLYPQKFDEQLVRSEFRPGLLEYAQNVADLYGRWVLLGKSFDAAHQAILEAALLRYATGGPERLRELPLLDLMRADADTRELLSVAMALHADPLLAARAVIDQVWQSKHTEAHVIAEVDLKNI